MFSCDLVVFIACADWFVVDLLIVGYFDSRLVCCFDLTFGCLGLLVWCFRFAWFPDFVGCSLLL